MARHIAIRSDEVDPGDVVAVHDGRPMLVRQVKRMHQNLIVLEGDCAQLHVGQADQLIGILHRPYKPGTTDRDALNSVAEWGREVAFRVHFAKRDKDEAIEALREALDVYELGKK